MWALGGKTSFGWKGTMKLALLNKLTKTEMYNRVLLQGYFWPTRSSPLLFMHAVFQLGTRFFSPRMNLAAQINVLFFSHFQLIIEMGRKKKNLNFSIRPSPFSILQNKAPIIWVWAVVVKNKCWWSSDVYNSNQVLLHIKTLYVHIIKARCYCLDWCTPWFQVANGVLMHPYESRPSLWQAGELMTIFRRPEYDRLSMKGY